MKNQHKLYHVHPLAPKCTLTAIVSKLPCRATRSDGIQTGRRGIYYRVTEEMYAESTRQRELAPLQAIRDNHEKAVIALNVGSTASVDGIKIIRLLDFLPE